MSKTHCILPSIKPSINNYRFDTKYFPATLDKALNENTSEQNQDFKTIQLAKDMLESNYSTEEIKELITTFEYIINNWLEEYEKKVFNNKTLKEILQSV